MTSLPPLQVEELPPELNPELVESEGGAPARSQARLFLRRFVHHKAAVLAAFVLTLLFASALFAPLVAPEKLDASITAESILNQNKPPSSAHLFGTDEIGRDQLTRILFAGRVSLTLGLSVALLSTLIGTVIGAVAGYYGGAVDQLLMRFTDLWLVIPSIVVLALAQKRFGGRPVTIIIILSFLFWQSIARIVRGLFLSLKEKEYVEAARASGASSLRVMARHMLPNIVGPILVNATLVVGTAIVTESTLSFLSFGIQPPDVSWGTMLFDAKSAVGNANAYLIYFPGLALLLTVLSVNFLGDGLRDAFDPQSQKH
ncbi:MAG: ABC transporter permease [Acidimicrobiales bacterium]